MMTGHVPSKSREVGYSTKTVNQSINGVHWPTQMDQTFHISWV